MFLHRGRGNSQMYLWVETVFDHMYLQVEIVFDLLILACVGALSTSCASGPPSEGKNGPGTWCRARRSQTLSLRVGWLHGRGFAVLAILEHVPDIGRGG